MANEDIVWSVNYEDIDVAAVEAEVREQAERKNPQQAVERIEAERKALEEKRQAEEKKQEEARTKEIERNEADRRSQELKAAREAQEQIAIAQEEARKIAVAARLEAERIKAEAKLEADRIKEDLERRQFEEEKRQLKHVEERSRFEAEKKKREAGLQAVCATTKAPVDQETYSSSQSHPKRLGESPGRAPWGAGLGQSPQITPDNETLISSLFAEDASATPKAVPPNQNPPPPPSSPVPNKPLLGSAFTQE